MTNQATSGMARSPAKAPQRRHFTTAYSSGFKVCCARTMKRPRASALPAARIHNRRRMTTRPLVSGCGDGASFGDEGSEEGADGEAGDAEEREEEEDEEDAESGAVGLLLLQL